MDKKTTEIHGAIKEFVSELHSVYSSDKGLALYNRLLQSPPTKLGTNGIQKHISSFELFFDTYGKAILDGNEIPDGAVISFNKSDKIMIDVTKILRKSDPATQKVIKQHLITIRTMINPSEEEIVKMEAAVKELGINTSTKEGAFIGSILDDAKSVIGGIEGDDPATAIGSLLGSGIIQKMIGGIQNGMSSGELDMGKLFGAMQGAMGALMSQQAEGTAKMTVVEEENEDKGDGAGPASEAQEDVPPEETVLADEPPAAPKSKKAKARARAKAKKAALTTTPQEEVPDEVPDVE